MLGILQISSNEYIAFEQNESDCLAHFFQLENVELEDFLAIHLTTNLHFLSFKTSMFVFFKPK